MANPARLVGQVKLRQLYNVQGQAYCAVSVSRQVMAELGWVPGEILTYYPTKDRALKFKSQNMLLKSDDPTYDDILVSESMEDETKGPRKGSIVDPDSVHFKANRQMEQWSDDLAAARLADRQSKAKKKEKAAAAAASHSRSPRRRSRR